MAIFLTCTCGQHLRTEESSAGKQVQCPSCSGILRVPEAETAIPALAPLVTPLPESGPPADPPPSLHPAIKSQAPALLPVITAGGQGPTLPGLESVEQPL